MTRKIFSGASQSIASGSTKLLHSGPGKVLSIVLTGGSTTPAAWALYDAVSAANTMISGWVSASAPVIIHFPHNTPLVFTTGLFAACASNCAGFVITEAEEP